MSEAFSESQTSPLTTKGDVFTYSTTNARLAVGSDTQKLIADSSQATGIKWADDQQWIVQASDQTFTDSTLANVTSLLFAMAASTSYFVEVFLLLNSDNTNADYKVGWTVPASCTMLWDHHGGIGNTSGIGANIRSAWSLAESTQAPTAFTTESGTVAFGALVGNTGAVFWAVVRNSTNAGNLQLQAAQNTTQAGTVTKVLKDSMMRVRKLQ